MTEERTKDRPAKQADAAAASEAEGAPERALVVIDDAPRMNLLGLLLGSIIERQAQQEPARKRLARLRGALVVKAGEMSITLSFADGRVTVSRGAAKAPRAVVEGSMQALMNVALGGGLVGPWLAGRLRTRGNPLLLLKVLPLMRT